MEARKKERGPESPIERGQVRVHHDLEPTSASQGKTFFIQQML